jgi:hypothetical protein
MSQANDFRSVRESYRRLSIDAGAALGVIDLNDPQKNAIVAPEESEPGDEAGISNSETSLALLALEDLEFVPNPVSLWKDTGRSNLDGVTSSMPSLVLILTSHHFVNFVTSKGGVWGDKHGAQCAVCMGMFEMGLMLIHLTNNKYKRRRLLMGIPVNILLNVLISCFVFDWRPGWIWTPVMMTFCLWLSACATHFINPEDKLSFMENAKAVLLISLALHGGIVAFIYSLVLPTRLLAENDNPSLTVIVTGAVFPGLAFLMRKFIASVIKKSVTNTPGLQNDARLHMMSRMTIAGSAQVLFVPAVLLYFNKSAQLALLSALTQLVTENVSKIVVIWHLKSNMEKQERAVENDPDALTKLRKKHKHSLAILALRWHSEMIAEKGCIICAGLVAYLKFEDLVEANGMELAAICLMFFCVEALTDVIFVQTMVTWFELPMLSAIPKARTCSIENFASSVMMAVLFNAMSVCVAMAAMVKL